MSKETLKYFLLRLEYPKFFSGELFQDSELLYVLGANYLSRKLQVKLLDRIWKMIGQDFNAEIYDDGNGWSLLVKLTNKQGKVLWHWSRK